MRLSCELNSDWVFGIVRVSENLLKPNKHVFCSHMSLQVVWAGGSPLVVLEIVHC